MLHYLPGGSSADSNGSLLRSLVCAPMAQSEENSWRRLLRCFQPLFARHEMKRREYYFKYIDVVPEGGAAALSFTRSAPKRVHFSGRSRRNHWSTVMPRTNPKCQPRRAGTPEPTASGCLPSGCCGLRADSIHRCPVFHQAFAVSHAGADDCPWSTRTRRIRRGARGHTGVLFAPAGRCLAPPRHRERQPIHRAGSRIHHRGTRRSPYNDSERALPLTEPHTRHRGGKLRGQRQLSAW